MVVAQEKIEWQEPLTQTYAAQNPRSPKRGKEYSKIKSILTLALIVGITGAISVETIHLTVVKGGQVQNLKKEISTIEKNNDLLKLEVDKLRAVGRIESVALSMGMEKPTGKVYMAGVVPTVKSQKGPPTTEVAKQPTEVKPTSLLQFSKIFTSFFASTQR